MHLVILITGCNEVEYRRAASHVDGALSGGVARYRVRIWPGKIGGCLRECEITCWEAIGVLLKVRKGDNGGKGRVESRRNSSD